MILQGGKKQMFNSNYGTSGLSPSDVLALSNDNGFGGNGSWVWLVIILFALFGWNNNGFGGYGGNGAMQNYVLGSDFATIQRQLSDGFGSTESKLDSVNNGICSLGYDQLGQMNGINMNIMQSANALQSQLADCCCKTQSGIESVKTADAFNTATITSAIKDCCCENEKIALQNRYESAQANCATLQAIQDSTKQIIDFMCNEKTQALRDENQALRLSASQQMQNNYLINQLRPSPIPSYIVANPYCNCNAGYIGNGFYGTTIA